MFQHGYKSPQTNLRWRLYSSDQQQLWKIVASNKLRNRLSAVPWCVLVPTGGFWNQSQLQVWHDYITFSWRASHIWDSGSQLSDANSKREFLMASSGFQAFPSFPFVSYMATIHFKCFFFGGMILWAPTRPICYRLESCSSRPSESHHDYSFSCAKSPMFCRQQVLGQGVFNGELDHAPYLLSDTR